MAVKSGVNTLTVQTLKATVESRIYFKILEKTQYLMKTLYFILRYALLGTVYQLSNECIQRTVLFCKTLLTFATVHFCTNLAYIAR